MMSCGKKWFKDSVKRKEYVKMMIDYLREKKGMSYFQARKEVKYILR
jgi:ABC-type microcin C transport system permease subunit YejB